MKTAFDTYCEEFQYSGPSTYYEGGYNNKDGRGSYVRFPDFSGAKDYCQSKISEELGSLYVDRVVIGASYNVIERERLYTA